MSVNLKGYKDLDVYQLSYRMAVEIFEETKNFPKEEKFSLTDQIRRSSRSVASNIAESWGKRLYRNHFISKLSDSYAEANETQTWLDFSIAHHTCKKNNTNILQKTMTTFAECYST